MMKRVIIGILLVIGLVLLIYLVRINPFLETKYQELKLGISIDNKHHSYNALIYEVKSGSDITWYVYPLAKYKKITKDPYIINTTVHELELLRNESIEVFGDYDLEFEFPVLDDKYFKSNDASIYDYINYKMISNRLITLEMEVSLKTGEITKVVDDLTISEY